MAEIVRRRQMYDALESEIQSVLHGLGIAPEEIEIRRSTEKKYTRATFDFFIQKKLAASAVTTEQLESMITGMKIAKTCVANLNVMDDEVLFAEPELVAEPEEAPETQKVTGKTSDSPRAGSLLARLEAKRKAEAPTSRRSASAEKARPQLRRRHNAPAEETRVAARQTPLAARRSNTNSFIRSPARSKKTDTGFIRKR